MNKQADAAPLAAYGLCENFRSVEIRNENTANSLHYLKFESSQPGYATLTGPVRINESTASHGCLKFVKGAEGHAARAGFYGRFQKVSS